MYPNYDIDENGELITGNISAKDQRQLTANIIANEKLDAIDVLIEPIYHPVKCPGLNLKNLYTRPGRFIPIDGLPENLLLKINPTD